MVEKTLAVLEGDGIGPEITPVALAVLDAIAEGFGHNFTKIYGAFGAQAYFDKGHPFPDETRDLVDNTDVTLKGPVGVATDRMKEIPVDKNPEGQGILPLRKQLDTFANYRPIKLAASFADFSPLRPEVVGDGIDILMMRELVGGIYFGRKVEGETTGMLSSSDDCDYTRDQVERFAKVCFEEARKRDALLTNVHKKNVLATSRFWNNVFQDVHKNGYSDVKMNEMLVDAVAYQLVINPTQFNGVMAMENMMGDILTDQAGGLLGSLGLMPSACWNPMTGKGYFEPAHGSAPDIAGKNVANPYSMIGSIALMLDIAFNLQEESQLVWDGLTDVFSQGYRTGELARKSTPKNKVLSTTAFGAKVVDYVKSHAPKQRR